MLWVMSPHGVTYTDAGAKIGPDALEAGADWFCGQVSLSLPALKLDPLSTGIEA